MESAYLIDEKTGSANLSLETTVTHKENRRWVLSGSPVWLEEQSHLHGTILSTVTDFGELK